MPTVKEISVGVTYNKNLGNYESIKPSATVVMTVGPGESVDEVFKQAWDIASEQVVEQLKYFNNDKRVVQKGF